MKKEDFKVKMEELGYTLVSDYSYKLKMCNNLGIKIVKGGYLVMKKVSANRYSPVHEPCPMVNGINYETILDEAALFKSIHLDKYL